MVSIPFLIDEHIPGSVRAFLLDRGHRLELVKTFIGEGAEDADVISAAMQSEMVVLTKNTRHYTNPAHRCLTDGYKDQRRWGLVVFEGKDTEALALFRDAIEIIEAEFAVCATRTPQTMMIFMELHGTQMRIHRTASRSSRVHMNP